MGVEEVAHGLADTLGESFHVAGDEAGGGDWLAYDQAERSWLDDIGIHRQGLVGSDDDQGDDGDLGLDGCVEGSAEEGLEVTIGAASTFGEDDERHSGFYRLRGGGERSQRGAGVGSVDGDLAGEAEMPSEKGQAEEFELGEDAELERERDVEHWNIEGRAVVGGVDGRLREVEAVESVDGEGGGTGVQDEPGPETGKAVLDASGAVQERAEEGEGSEDDGVKVDERIAHQVGGELGGEPVGVRAHIRTE